MERKVLDIADLKLKDDGDYPNGLIEGYAATWDVDSVNERIERGAFRKHLPKFLSEGFVAFNHDWQSLPVAMPIDAYEDEKGLFVRAAFHSTPEAQNVRRVAMERMARGLAVKNSIGYEVHADGREQETRILKELELYEWSPVNVPANRAAGATGIKSGGVPSGLNEHISEVVSALDVVAERVRERHDFRKKEGRVLSGSNRQRISALLERLAEVEKDLNDLLTETEMPAKSGWAETHRLRAETLLIVQRLKGVGVSVTP